MISEINGFGATPAATGRDRVSARPASTPPRSCPLPGFAIECALGRKYTGYAAMLEKARQAERNARDHGLPVAVLKAPRIADADALVVMRLPTFLAWFGPSAAKVE